MDIHFLCNDQLLTLYRHNIKAKEAALYFGCPEERVLRYYNAFKKAKVLKHAKRTPQQVINKACIKHRFQRAEAILILYREGFNAREVAAFFNMTPPGVYRYYRKYKAENVDNGLIERIDKILFGHIL